MQLLIAIALIVLSSVLGGANPAGPDSNPEVVADVIYGHKFGMALTFDVFQPSTEAKGAGVLYMVSGGWNSRWLPPHRLRPRFQGLLDRGFTVFAVRHGSSPKFKVPEAVEDVRRAVRFIRSHSREFGIDPERLGVLGGSAGGHLSLVLGTVSDGPDATADSGSEGRTSSRVAAVVAYFPPVDLRSVVGPNARFPALDFDPALAEAISPIAHVSSDDAPTLLIHGDKDRLVPLSNSERIKAAFDSEGVTAKMVVIEGAGHGFRGEDAARAQAAMENWFVKYLTGSGE